MNRQRRRFVSLLVFVMACHPTETPSPHPAVRNATTTEYFALTFEMMDGTDELSWSDFAFDRVRLERSGCYGECPVYAVELRRGGAASYWGQRFAPREGAFEGRMSVYGFGLLCAVAERIELDQMRAEYPAIASDGETVTVTLEGPFGSHTIVDRDRQAPPEFHAFRALFDELAEQVDWRSIEEVR